MWRNNSEIRGSDPKVKIMIDPLSSQYKNPNNQSGILSPKPISISSATIKKYKKNKGGVGPLKLINPKIK